MTSTPVRSVPATEAHPGATMWSPRPTALGCALVSAGLALLVAFLAPRGNDYAAHLYQLHVFVTRGPAAWTNLWYSGQYTFWTYSLLVYPLAALIGLPLLGAASVTASVAAVTVLLGRAFGPASRPAAWVFAVVWPTYLLSADFPFTLGTALALGALVCLQARRPRFLAGFVVLALATLAASPLAFGGLAILVATLGLSGRLRGHRLFVSWATMAVGGGAEVALWRAFPYNGRYPFWGQDYFSTLAFTIGIAVLAWRIPRRRDVLTLCGLYAVACSVLFLVPSAVGANLVRVQYAAVPIVVLVAALRRWRPLLPCVVAVILAGAWTLRAQLGPPLFESPSTASAASATYWSPAVSYLRAHLTPDQRVEAVDIQNHWPALYLGEAGIPLARGWYRQDDFPLNRFLYHPFSVATYKSWLHRLGIAYVVVSTATPDFSAAEEARIVRDGDAGLTLVERSPTVDVYAVRRPTQLLTGPGHPRVLAAGPDGFLLSFSRAGRYGLAVRWNPYWSAPGICARRQPDGLTTLEVSRVGVTRLRVVISASRLASMVLGSGPAACHP